MEKNKLLNQENKKKLLNLIYSIGATAVFNMVIQFLLYPNFERELGTNTYGIVLTLISLLAITAGTCGYAVNCSRMLGVSYGRTQSSDYNIILLLLGSVCSLIGVAALFYLDLAAPLAIGLWILLTFSTMLRYYSEIEFRLSTNFFRYMIYFLLISVGYVVGLFVFRASGEWTAALICGEILAFAYVFVKGTIYRRPFFKKSPDFPAVFSSVSFLIISIFIENITLHADRILLLTITGDGSAVTTYYIASLTGKLIALLTVPINSLLISYLARYNGKLSKKLWTAIIAIALALCALAFVAAMIISPWIIGILYSDNLEAVRPFLFPAILGQIFFFGSCVLMAILLCFKGEKKQLAFNAAYAAEFFVCVIAGTLLGGLCGFVWSILLANAIRFFAAIIWGFVGKKQR